ncbi:MAG: peptidase S9 [candidate division Zixibacteria bacterium SM23_81]|nr:MAG: peptidase S9 [candidate division Zixibacteria bacterium SM23_81]
MFAVGMIIFLASLSFSSDATQLPETPKKPVTDVYHGVEVTEDYRWLEDFDDPMVRQWSDEQNHHARTFLNGIRFREGVHERLEKLLGGESAEYSELRYRRGLLFALKSQPPKEQKFLVTLQSPHDLTSERIVVDPNEMEPKGMMSIDWYVPSLDGQRVAVSMSEGGSEVGTVHVYKVTGEKLPDVIPRVNGPTAGGSVAWNADGSGFYYTHYPRAGERPLEDMSFYQQVYCHTLDTPTDEDTYSIGKEFPRIAEIDLESSVDGQYILAAVANGDGGEFAHYLLGPSGRWTQITRFADGIPWATFGLDNAIYLLSKRDAPMGKILRLPPRVTDPTQATTVVGESDVGIMDCLPTTGRLYVRDDIGGPRQIRVFDYEGQPLEPIPLKPVSSVWGMIALEGDEILFNNTSYVDPPAWYIFNPSTGKLTQTAFAVTSPADFSDVEVVREFAISKDGTRVPLNIMRRKGTKLDGQNPTLLTGYGGYGNSRRPRFNPELRLWLDHGGIWVDTNLRGGGEFGEEWHRAGNLTEKQNVFDDFAACAQHLIEAKYTNPAKLAIEGGSNGGLLMGAALTQHPDLFRAVVTHAGIYDMLRVELDPNGAFNVTEFGTVKIPEHFEALYAYSPYHHVTDGTGYPDVFFLTGLNDGRVNPAHSRKMVARLQAASSSKGYVLLRTSSTTGHGMGTGLSERIAKETDVFTFLFDRLNIEYEP